MKRKISFLIGACMALVAFAALPTSAGALVDRDCDGDPYYNNVAIHDLEAETDKIFAKVPSGITGSVLVCGSRLGEGNDRLVEDIVFTLPRRAAIGRTVGEGLEGRFVGTISTMRWLQKISILPATNVELSDISMTVADPTAAGNDCSDTAETIACFRADIPLWGHMDISAGADEDGLRQLTLHKFQPILGVMGITKIIDLQLCERLGEVDSRKCGNDTDPVVFRNGSASQPNCQTGVGIIAVNAALDDGGVTPATDESEACLDWLPLFTDTEKGLSWSYKLAQP